MALPTTITVKGKYLKLDGTPESGTVQFFSKVYVLHSEDETAVVPSEVKVYLDETGSFEVDLPASNDPDWTPVGWVYRVILKLSGDYSIFQTVIPYDAPGGEIYMTELLPASSGNNSLYASFSHTHSGFVEEDEVTQLVDEAVAEAVIGLGDDFALASHTHAAADIVSGTIALARLPVGVGSNQVAAGDHTHNYDAVYAALGHNHSGVYSLVGHNHDSAYATIVHTHAYADITGTPTLDKAAVGLANVDNTSDTNKPISTATQTALNLKAPLASPAFTGTVSGITKAMVGLANVDNTTDVDKPISDATQDALDLKAPLANPTFTGTVNGVTKAMVGLSDVDNTADSAKPISTAQQSALDAKAPLASPTFTGTVSGVTKAMVGLGSVDNTADTAKPVSTAQQTALNLKANLASPTFTGTVSGITKAMVGLTNVDNTADSAKPVSTAQQTALDAKVDEATLTTKGDLYVATAAGIVSRVGVGSNNQILTADSAQTAGLKWADAPAGGGTAPTFVRAVLASVGGDFAVGADATWTPISGLTLAIPAVVGDDVELNINCLLDYNSARTDFFDACVIVGGSAVRFGSTNTSTSAAANEGDPSGYPGSERFGGVSLLMSFTVASGDLSGGNVTFSIAHKGVGGGKIFASNNYPFRWRARNDH